MLEINLPSDDKIQFTVLDIIELIDVRVYKTRGTDPKSELTKFLQQLNKNTKLEYIESWMLWFNNRWMSKELFQSYIFGNIYGNRALVHIFIDYCEYLQKRKYTIEELNTIINKIPNIEHVLSQTPKFAPRALGFRNTEDFVEYEHMIGNLTILERSLNSAIQNKSAIDKIETYGKSIFKMTKKIGADIDTNKQFLKQQIESRTDEIAEYCLSRWWC